MISSDLDQRISEGYYLPVGSSLLIGNYDTKKVLVNKLSTSESITPALI